MTARRALVKVFHGRLWLNFLLLLFIGTFLIFLWLSSELLRLINRLVACFIGCFYDYWQDIERALAAYIIFSVPDFTARIKDISLLNFFVIVHHIYLFAG